MINIGETADTLSFKVLAAPNSSRTAIAGEHDGALKIKLAAPPVDGKANAACLKFLAKLLKLPKTSLDISSGSASKRKQVTISFTPDADGKKEKQRVKAIIQSAG